MGEGRQSGSAGPRQPTTDVAASPDAGPGVVAYLVGRLANEPASENAQVVAELLAVELGGVARHPACRQRI